MTHRNLRPWRTAAFDIETDPFVAGRIPQPFCCGVALDDGTETVFWGFDCIDRAMECLQTLSEKYLVYVHNGGRFDFNYMWDYVEDPVTILGGRLVEFEFAGHVFRDSFAILPLPLDEFGTKRAIDYAKFEADIRENHRNEIEAYVAEDCRQLLSAVLTFRDRFEGERREWLPLSLGSLALREFSKHHAWARASKVGDTLMRPWYFGGRTQVFRGGILEGPWLVVDCNSHYGAAMAREFHPNTDELVEMGRPPVAAGPWFARILADNAQALPWRDPETDQIHFDISHGEFNVCGHELVPAVAAGLVRVHEWREIWRPVSFEKFDRFVATWMDEKIAAEIRGDKLGRQLAKLIIAAVSGKLGQDPRRFSEWTIVRDPRDDERMEAEGWIAQSVIRNDPERWLELWAKPSPVMSHSFVNVGMAASILSASRAIMLAAIPLADEPIYCDTDSLICRAFHGTIDPFELGAWKIECAAEYAAIAGRKTYCLYNKVGRKIVPVKWASKGETLSPQEIISMARGGAVDKVNEAPRFSLRGAPPFQKRTYRRTV